MIEKGVSHIAYFRLDGGSSKLYTQEYVDEKDEEIKRLKEEYMILQNASDEVEEEKDKEIERQKEIIRQLDIKNLELTTIIKEVRGYIWSTKYEYGDLEEDNEDFDIDVYKLLEILDKEKTDE